MVRERHTQLILRAHVIRERAAKSREESRTATCFQQQSTDLKCVESARRWKTQPDLIRSLRHIDLGRLPTQTILFTIVPPLFQVPSRPGKQVTPSETRRDNVHELQQPAV
jgi:hypothetical protein